MLLGDGSLSLRNDLRCPLFKAQLLITIGISQISVKQKYFIHLVLSIATNCLRTKIILLKVSADIGKISPIK
jgi:hypothetical protein